MGLDTVELLLKIEEDFDIKLSDSEAQKILTVGELSQLISVTTSCGNSPVSVDQAFDHVAKILETDFGVKNDLITPNARIVKDLGLD